jgi:hypothetical protein
MTQAKDGSELWRIDRLSPKGLRRLPAPVVDTAAV